MTLAPLTRIGQFALKWVLLASIFQIALDLTTYAVTQRTTGTSITGILTLPLRLVLNLPNPYSGLTSNSTVLTLLYVETLVMVLLVIWIALMRHGYGNPLNLLRPEHELPLSRQLTPKLRDLGLWVKYDAARGHPKASIMNKIRTRLVKTLRPNADLSRALTRRTNGILVPYHGEQPGARIFLGTYRHLHLFRRRRYNVYARPEQHVVIFGPSGAGKGATQMNPTLLFWNGDTSDSPDGHGSGWPGSIITSTVKSDHVDVALEWRLSLSDQCYVYDPLQLYPEYRDFWVGWNPLSTVTSFSEAAAVAVALMESESQQSGASGGNEDYFKAQALMVLGPMILSAARAKVPFRTVYDWSLRIESETTDTNVVAENGDVAPDSAMYAALEPLVDYAEETGDQTPLNQMQQVFTKDPREASGVWGSVRKVLQPYNDEKSVKSTDPTQMPRMFDPRAFYTTPHATLFIVAPEVANESRRMRPVFAAFITWLIEEAQKLSRENNGKLPHPVLANLDEVKNVGAIPGLAHTLSLTRSIGFFVKHAWQDEAQIAAAYGKDDAKTITSNSRTWVILPGISDPDHLEALSRLIGERPVKRRKAKTRDDNDEKSRMRSASASMVKEIKDDELLILTDNLPPFVIKATRYFLDNIMNNRYKLGDNRRSTGVMPNPAVLRPSHSSQARPELSYDAQAPSATAHQLGAPANPNVHTPDSTGDPAERFNPYATNPGVTLGGQADAQLPPIAPPIAPSATGADPTPLWNPNTANTIPVPPPDPFTPPPDPFTPPPDPFTPPPDPFTPPPDPLVPQLDPRDTPTPAREPEPPPEPDLPNDDPADLLRSMLERLEADPARGQLFRELTDPDADRPTHAETIATRPTEPPETKAYPAQDHATMDPLAMLTRDTRAEQALAGPDGAPDPATKNSTDIEQNATPHSTAPLEPAPEADNTLAALFAKPTPEPQSTSETIEPTRNTTATPAEAPPMENNTLAALFAEPTPEPTALTAARDAVEHSHDPDTEPTVETSREPVAADTPQNEHNGEEESPEGSDSGINLSSPNTKPFPTGWQSLP